jgi:hypothetical protein
MRHGVRLSLLVLAAWTIACRRGPVTSRASTTAPQASASCAGFGGKIHGVSACLRYDREANTVTRHQDRVRATSGLQCGQDVTLQTLRLEIRCAEQVSSLESFRKRAIVEAVIIEDHTHPSLNGRRLELDEHEGFWDFVNVWVVETERGLDFTIDYVVLD